MNFYSPETEKAIPADIIHEVPEGGVYLGWFERSKARQDTPLEAQPIWRIRFLRQTTDSSGTITATTWPKGSKSYEFVWNDRTTYEYNYSR